MLIVFDLPIVIILKVRFKEALSLVKLTQQVRQPVELTLCRPIEFSRVVKIQVENPVVGRTLYFHKNGF
jgi:hypothetical protein